MQANSLSVPRSGQLLFLRSCPFSSTSPVSTKSPGSVWVRKELLGALNFGRTAICIVLPCNNDCDLALCRLMAQSADFSHFARAEHPEDIQNVDTWVQRACEFRGVLDECASACAGLSFHVIGCREAEQTGAAPSAVRGLTVGRNALRERIEQLLLM